MLPFGRRITGVADLIDQQLYFVVHAPRQTGKTTSYRALATELSAAGRYAALHVSCENAQAAGGDVALGIETVLRAIEIEAEVLPEAFRPPPVDDVLGVAATSQLQTHLTRWSERSPRPVALFLDEIDSVLDNTLISVLRQLRTGYPSRPQRFPHSIVLIGVRDVRDYRASVRGERSSLGTASPFNIKSDSLTMRDFTATEVAELYRQHTADSGQRFTDAAAARAFELTRGQPWLVNALGRQLIERIVPDRSQAIDTDDVDQAGERLIERRDTHLDSLLETLREARVRRVIAPILAGELVLGERLDDDIAYVEDLGLVSSRDGSLEIANPIYHEIIPRALAAATQKTIPYRTEWYVRDDGRLDMDGLLAGFLEFWREHGEAMLASQPYREVAFQLVVMSFLQRITNGGGRIDREYAIGRGRMDLFVHWPYPGGIQREALELKVWHDEKADPLDTGLVQLGRYLADLKLDHGALLVFDRRTNAPPPAERSTLSERQHDGRRIVLLRL